MGDGCDLLGQGLQPGLDDRQLLRHGCLFGDQLLLCVVEHQQEVMQLIQLIQLTAFSELLLLPLTESEGGDWLTPEKGRIDVSTRGETCG